MNVRKKVRRWVYIIISLFGIGYELTRKDNISWPLIAGYTFIISATIYTLQVQKPDETEESE